MYRFVTLAALFALLNPVVFAAHVDGGPDLKLVPQDNSFAPGESGRFTFSIMNNGDVSTPGPQGLEKQVMMAEGLTYSVGGEGNASVNIRDDVFAVGSVPKGLFQKKMGFSVSVWDNASSGTYTVPVALSYDYKDSISYNASTGVVKDYSYDDNYVVKHLILRVRKTANLKLLSSSFSGSVGDSGILSLRVKNAGNASVSDLSFSLNSMNPDLSFGRSANAEKFIGSWGKGEVKTLKFRASVSGNAVKSEMSVQASASFQNDGYPEHDSFKFGVGVGGENKVSLRNVDAELRKGSKDSITGTVVNDAGRPLNSVKLVFRPDDPYLTVDQPSFAVGKLPAGGEANFSFPVEVSSDAEPGPRLYSVSAVYRNADGDRRSKTSVDFDSSVVDSRGDFVVRPVNNSVALGGSSLLKLNVTNPSSSTYRNVDAKIFTSDPLSSDDDRAFVSELGPGETRTLEFKVSSSGSALSKSYPVRMDFRYELDGDSKFSKTFRTAVNVEKPEKSSGAPVLPIAAVIVVLIVLGASYYSGRPESVWGREEE